jgi:hypothetical protein
MLAAWGFMKPLASSPSVSIGTWVSSTVRGETWDGGSARCARRRPLPGRRRSSIPAPRGLAK